jgi:hypothetical protein
MCRFVYDLVTAEFHRAHHRIDLDASDACIIRLTSWFGRRDIMFKPPFEDPVRETLDCFHFYYEFANKFPKNWYTVRMNFLPLTGKC